MLLGRATYEGFATAWPSMQKDPLGYSDRMNSLPKYVVSTKLDEARWNNSRIIKGNLAEKTAELKKEGNGNILIFGSGDLVNSLAREGLVDQFNLWVYPLVLGSGRRLFQDGTSLSSLKLLEARSFDSGVALLRYVTFQSSR